MSDSDGKTNTHVVVSADVNHTLRAAVQAKNAAGSAWAVSLATGVVGGTPPPPPPVRTVTSSLKAGDVVKGSVLWQATPSETPTSIRFDRDFVAGKSFTDTSAPYAETWDTTLETNGTHALGLTVAWKDGTVEWEPYQWTVDVENGSNPGPTTAQLIDLTIADLKNITIGYVQWAKNVAANKYPDPKQTWWGKALSQYSLAHAQANASCQTLLEKAYANLIKTSAGYNTTGTYWKAALAALAQARAVA